MIPVDLVHLDRGLFLGGRCLAVPGPLGGPGGRWHERLHFESRCGLSRPGSGKVVLSCGHPACLPGWRAKVCTERNLEACAATGSLHNGACTTMRGLRARTRSVEQYAIWRCAGGRLAEPGRDIIDHTGSLGSRQAGRAGHPVDEFGLADRVIPPSWSPELQIPARKSGKNLEFATGGVCQLVRAPPPGRRPGMTSRRRSKDPLRAGQESCMHENCIHRSSPSIRMCSGRG
jgi:hypothetical protein